MGNCAVITTPERRVGLYPHWNGGRDTVEPLLRYCELQGCRPPSQDAYGWARMCQVMGNFFGGSTSLGIAVTVDTPDGKRDITYPDLPYVANYDYESDFSWNSNNYIHGDMARIKPRG